MESITKLLKSLDVSYQEFEVNLTITSLKPFKFKNIKLMPITYTYEKFNYKGNSFIFVKDLKPYKFIYLKEVEHPLGIITNSNIDTFCSNIPVFFTKEELKTEKFTMEIKEKTHRKKEKIYYFNFGYGYRFINVFITVLENRNIKIFREILNKLKTVNYPRGYRVRFIFFNKNSKTFIEKIYKEYFKDAHFNILVDSTGFGLEKLIYKTNGFIHLNKEMLEIINNHLNISYNIENSFEDLKIDNLIWFKSLEKNPYVDNSQDVAKNIFACINFLAKEMI